jgi:hypothetical protein
MLRTLKEMIRPPRLADRAAFGAFVAGESALIAQKTAVSYCRAKTLTFSHALFAEQAFQDALAICRFEAFAAVLADLLLLTAGLLRPHAEPARIDGALRALYGEILRGERQPAHRQDGWADAEAAFAARLAALDDAAPRDPASIARASAARLYEVLPIHTNHRHLDEDVITASVTFQMVGLWEKLLRALDAPAVARDLAG